MSTGYDELIERLRAASRPAGPAPPEMSTYLEKVRSGAYAITDRDVQALREAGLPEEQIFEQTAAVAVDSGLSRLAAALGVLR